MQIINKVVQNVIYANDKRWIPEELRGNIYFSSNVIWQFIPSWDVKQCGECGEYALGIPFFSGAQIRSIFPYMEVKDENTINANVHPNCRCILSRDVSGEEPVVSEEEAKEAFITRKQK
jgi:hypothetical protein